ncbi:MAG: hypothetical protein GY703_09635 [Gammaproteobacteria bacterium]|nr:hypothetical protein [Gammaproteobacteria bacterium]
MMESTIRRRISDVMSAANQPLTPGDIRTKGSYPKSDGVLIMALRAMQRDGEVHEWQPGYWVTNGFAKNWMINPIKNATDKPGPKKKKRSVQGKRPINDRKVARDISTNDLHRRCKPVPIIDMDLKLNVLDKLSKMMAPDVAEVLQGICDDLRGRAKKTP